VARQLAQFIRPFNLYPLPFGQYPKVVICHESDGGVDMIMDEVKRKVCSCMIFDYPRILNYFQLLTETLE